MQTILVPVDFSQASHNAASYAAELAKAFHAKLLLFHAYMMPTPVSEIPYVMVTADEMQKENERQLKKDADKLTNTYQVETEWLVRIGVPSDEIRELTREAHVDMVVMGMKGAGGIDKIIGSTTSSAIRKSLKPVIVVPHDAAFSPIKNIIYVNDALHKSTLHILHPLLQITGHFHARVHVLEIHRPSESLAVDKAVANALENTDHEFVVMTDHSQMRGINQYLTRHEGELLVMVEHRHNFFERVFSRDPAAAMAHETRIPLMVLHDRE